MGWIVKIHNCKTPNLAEVQKAEAQVGNTWVCEDTPPDSTVVCGDEWKLRQIVNNEGLSGIGRSLPKWDRLTVNGETIGERNSSDD